MTTKPVGTFLDDLNEGRVTAIGWGCGEVFRAMREILHSFPMVTTIHNNAALHGSSVSGVSVVAPTVLDDINQLEDCLCQ